MSTDFGVVGAISDLCQSVVICAICVRKKIDSIRATGCLTMLHRYIRHHSSAIAHQALKSESFHGIEWLWGVVVS